MAMDVSLQPGFIWTRHKTHDTIFPPIEMNGVLVLDTNSLCFIIIPVVCVLVPVCLLLVANLIS